MTARVEWLDVGGPVDPWRRLGLVVADDGLVPLVGTVLRLTGGAEPGITGWALSGVVACGDVDGLATEIVEEQTPRFARHELGAVALDHVVVATDSLERTSGALADATGEPLKRVREAGDLVQGFHRIGRGGLIVEIVERAGLPVSERCERTPTTRAPASPAATGFGGAAPDVWNVPAAFWGLVLVVDDLGAAVDRLGSDVVGPAKAAVQPGRRIATVRSNAGLGVPVALMNAG